jgi:hypothetical protein
VTIRRHVFSGVTTYAGGAAELATLALDHAAGAHGRVTADEKARFETAAEHLANGRVVSDSPVRFWPDGADGSPWEGNPDYRPAPDPTWAAAQAARARRQ